MPTLTKEQYADAEDAFDMATLCKSGGYISVDVQTTAALVRKLNKLNEALTELERYFPVEVGAVKKRVGL